MPDESMSTIRSHTNPKCDLPHCSYIFRKPEPLGVDMNDMACYGLGNMLYPKIQKGKDAMKTAKFQQDNGGTASYMNRRMMAIKVRGKLTSN